MKRKIIGIVISIVLVFSLLPGVAHAASPYNATDRAKIGAFLALANNGHTNGYYLDSGHTYDSLDPGTWAHVTWTDDGSTQNATAIDWGNSILSGKLVGDLDLTGCNKLANLDVNGNNITSIEVNGNTALTTFDFGGNNGITNAALDFSGCTNLHELYCFSTSLDSLNLTNFSHLTILNANNCASLSSVTGFSSSAATFTDFYISNDAITNISIDSLTHLTTAQLSGNPMFQLSAHLNGHDIVLKRAGSGYVGLDYNSGTVTAQATAQSHIPAYSFFDWTDGIDWSTPLSTSQSYILTAAPYNITASFTNSVYSVTYNANGGTLTGVANDSANAGNTVAQPTDPTRTGYVFGGWYKGAALTNAYDFSTPINHNTTLYAKWNTLASTPAPASGTTSISPSSLSMYAGGRATLTPAAKGGNWSYDQSLVKLVQNADGTVTVTALKAGTAVIRYSIGWADADVTITIGARSMPQTGQDFTLLYVLIALAACASASTVVILKMHKKAKQK